MSKKYTSEAKAEQEYPDGNFQCDGCNLYCCIYDHACNSSACEVHGTDGDGNYCDECCPD